MKHINRVEKANKHVENYRWSRWEDIQVKNISTTRAIKYEVN